MIRLALRCFVCIAVGLAFAVHAENAELHDLATVGLVAPPRVTLSAEHPSRAKPVVVFIQNRGSQNEIIPDAASLAKLVVLDVQSLGPADAPVPALVPRAEFPIILRPRRKLPVVFSVTFDRANDPARSTRVASHDDFRYTASVHRETLDGNPDARTENDTFPRTDRVVQTDVILAASFPGATPNGSGANSLGPTASSLANPVRTRAVQHAGRAAVFTRLTANPMQVAIRKGETLSDPIVFTATYSGTSSGLSWSPGDAVPPFVYAGNTFKCRWNTGGDHTVTAYIFDNATNPHKSITIQVIKVTLQDEMGGDPSGLTIGVTTKSKDRSRTLKAMVEPKSQTDNVSIRIGRGGANLAVKGTPMKDSGAGTVTFQVEGIGTTGSRVMNDCTIEAVVGGKAAASADVTVVVPKFIEPQINLGRHDRNFLAYQSNGHHPGSSPNLRGSPVYPMAWRATFFGFDIKVPVTDQFHHPIDGDHLYAGAEVFEAVPEGTSAINQQIQSGSFYLDPSGFPNRSPNPNPTPINATGPSAGAFKATSPFFHSPYENLPLLSNVEIIIPPFSVLVDGFQLQPKIERKLTVFPFNIIQLDNKP